MLIACIDCKEPTSMTTFKRCDACNSWFGLIAPIPCRLLFSYPDAAKVTPARASIHTRIHSELDIPYIENIRKLNSLREAIWNA